MNTRNTLPLILALMIALLTGCTNRVAMEELAYLETRMEANADSVRTALAAMNGNRLRGEARALHALLYSQALDKCYIDVTNDSLISIATKYYRKGDEPLRALQALYYQGRVMENSQNQRKAIELYTQAMEYVDKVNAPYTVGLLHAHLGHLYREDYNLRLALEHLKKSHDYYKQSGNERMQHIAMRNIGSTYLFMEDAENAELYLNAALDWGIKHEDKSLCKSTISYLIRLYDAMNDTTHFASLYRSNAYIKYCDNVNIASYLARYHAQKGDGAAAEEALSQAWELSANAKDTAMLWYKNYQVYKMLGNIDAALRYNPQNEASQFPKTKRPFFQNEMYRGDTPTL